jgi:hypothetical protein
MLILLLPAAIGRRAQNMEKQGKERHPSMPPGKAGYYSRFEILTATT